jgi:phospholipase/carboxylesterase
MAIRHPADLSLVHRVRLPVGNAAAHPAIVCLHGRGSHDDDLLGLAPFLDERLLWISPRAPLALGGGFEWYRLEGIGLPHPPSFEAGVRALRRFLAEAVAAYPVDRARLLLFGFSQGGMMAYAVTLTEPARAAGVIAHSSYIPLDAIRNAFSINAAGLSGKPFLLAHGLNDPIIPVDWGREARTTLAGLGAEVEYHEFPGGHHVSEASLEALRQWAAPRLNLSARPA